MNDNTTDTGPVELIQVSIFNQIYSLRSHKDGEHIRQIAKVVDERMRLISSQITTHDLAKLAVLAALNIADELQSLRDYYEQEVQTLFTQISANSEEPGQIEKSNEAASVEGSEPRSWFEAIFDSEVPVKSSNERLSSQISAKLQSLRQAGHESLTIEAEDEIK